MLLTEEQTLIRDTARAFARETGGAACPRLGGGG